MFKILHTADWHPQSEGTLAGVLRRDPETGLSLTLTDFKRSLEFIWQVIKQEQVDLLLLAGDVFDTEEPTVDEYRAVMEFLQAAAEETEVVAIAGNHDLPQVGSASPATWPIGVCGVHSIATPQAILSTILGHRVRIDCLPYPRRGQFMASTKEKLNPEQVNQRINDGLAHILRGFRVEHEPGEVRILLGHGATANATVGEQPRSMAHDIMIPVGDLDAHYHYLAFGHIHKCQQVSGRGWYSGSLTRSGFGEEGEEKGFLMVDLDERGPAVRFVANPHARIYKTVSVTHDLKELAGDAETVFRVKGEVEEGDLTKLKDRLAVYEDKIPYLQVNVQVTRPDRARDPNMVAGLSVDQALDRCLEKDQVETVEAEAIRNIHGRFLREIGR